MKTPRILMTGNPSYGLAQMFQKFSPQTVFASRSTEPTYDLTDDADQDRLAEAAVNFDIFINNSYIDHFAQVHLARKIWTIWRKNRHAGFLINIGSAATDLVRPDNRLYPVSKQALVDLSRRLYLHSIWEDSKIRVTYLSFGGIATEGTLKQWPHYQHLPTEFCAQVLHNLLQYPENTNIDFLQISPIQPISKSKIVKPPAEKDSSEFLSSHFNNEI